MAGRGRGATLPAWMTAGGGDGMSGVNGNGAVSAPASYHPQPAAGGQYDDYSHSAPARNSAGYAPPAQSAPIQHQMPPQYSSAPPQDRRGPSANRDSSRNSSSSGTGSTIGSWKRGGTRVSNFDVRPPDGVELPPIGVISTPSGVPNSYFSYANNPAVSGAPLPGTGMQGLSKYGGGPGATPVVDANMATRHARRIYAGGIPARATEVEIANFFNDIVTRALAPVRLDGPPVLKVYLNTEKCYAFVEFPSIELCTACMSLDGVRFDHYTGPTIIRVRRPNDYRPELLPPSTAPIPVLNISVLGLTGVSSNVSGPGKVFVGGLPYNLTDEQVMELLGAFGPIKAFHQVRDPGSVTTKGYGFCEYVNIANAEAAIAGLNGMALGDKTLTVRIATTGSGNNPNGAVGGAGFPAAGMYQQPQTMPGAMGGYGGLAGGVASGPAPTRVLRLSNMVTRDEIYNEAEFQDIREDVRLECLQYGKVNSVIIPRACDNYSSSAEGLIFVEFDSVDGARAAANVLNGRKFADKTVVVGFFNEQEFASQRLI